MKKGYFLFFLPWIGFGSLALADSFYTGFQAGADFFTVTKSMKGGTMLTPMASAPNFTAETRNSGIGGVGGAFLGYAWQFQDFSFGLEAFAYGDGSTVKKTAAEVTLLGLSASESDRLKGFFGGAIKPGYLVNEKAKLYGKAGWVNGRFSMTGTETRVALASLTPTGTVSATTSEWLSGGQLGVGVELFMTPHVALTVEYNHIQYKKRTFGFVSNLFPGVNQVQRTAIRYHPQSNNALLGITYYFTPQETGFSITKDDGGYDEV